MTQKEAYESIATLIRCSAEQLVKDKFLWKSSTIKTSPEQFSQMLLDAFFESINNEREQYLKQLTERLYRVNKERKSFEVETQATKAAPDSELAELSKENDELKAQIVAFEEELKSLEWKYNRKQSFYQEKLKQKAEQVQQIHALLEHLAGSHQVLARQLEGLKSSAVRLHRGQVRLAMQAKAMILSQIEEMIEEKTIEYESEYSGKLAKVEDAIEEQHEQLRQAEREAKTILDALEEIGVKTCPVDELPKKLSTLKENVRETLDHKREAAIENLRKEVQTQLPGIDIAQGNIADAVTKHLTAKIKEKEKECNDLLRKGEARERKLRQQLDEAISKIQKLQNSRNEDLAYIDEFERSKRLYEEQQRKLDEQMSALGMGK